MSDEKPEVLSTIKSLSLFCSFCGRPVSVDYVVMEGRQPWGQRWLCLACHRHNLVEVAGLVVVARLRDKP